MEDIEQAFSDSNTYFNGQTASLQFRFDKMKDKESRQRRFIEFFSQKISNKLMLKNSFNKLLLRHKEMKRIDKKDEVARRFFEGFKLKQVFRNWRHITSASATENRHARVYYKQLTNLKFGYDDRIRRLKEQILEVEEKISLVDKAYKECSHDFSQSLLKAMNALNKEILTVNSFGLEEGRDTKNAKLILENLDKEYHMKKL